MYKMSAKDKVLSKIFEDPSKRYYVRELAHESKVNPNSVLNVVKELEKDGLVKKETKKHITEISAILDSPSFTAKKLLFNLAKIYESKIIDFLVENYHPKAIILFGSYSRGEDIKKSDIDIAIVTDNHEIMDMEKFEKTLNRRIHLVPIDYKKISDELYINLINGIVVYGYMDKK